MKFDVVNKSTTVNRFALHTLHRNITHLAIITLETKIKLGILKGGNWKRASDCFNNRKAEELAHDKLILTSYGTFKSGGGNRAISKTA